MSFDLREKIIEPTNLEEARFILQAAFAPISILHRMLIQHKSIGAALIETIDRNAYLKSIRQDPSKK